MTGLLVSCLSVALFGVPVQGPGFLAFTRSYQNPMFTITLLTSPDGVSFTEVGHVFNLAAGQTFYDAHIAIDNSVCPPMYVMSMECIGHEGAASLCISQSAYPGHVETWSAPMVCAGVACLCVVGGGWKVGVGGGRGDGRGGRGGGGGGVG